MTEAPPGTNGVDQTTLNGTGAAQDATGKQVDSKSTATRPKAPPKRKAPKSKVILLSVVCWGMNNAD